MNLQQTSGIIRQRRSTHVLADGGRVAVRFRPGHPALRRACPGPL